MFSKKLTTKFTKNYLNNIEKIKLYIENADYLVIGAGAGLSTSAGLLYSGERFEKLFPDFIAKYNLTDMYTSAFYKHDTIEEYWGYFSKHIYYNRYEVQGLNDTYNNLYNIAKNKDYFVITTNADHLFLSNGFDKNKIFYTQGDYGLFQCSKPCHNKTYDNKEIIYNMVKMQENLKIPSELVPHCPLCGELMDVNLRKDDTFVQDEGWDKAHDRYIEFLKNAIYSNKNVLFLELGIGYNTPAIIKYPFWQMTQQIENSKYICINKNDATCSNDIISKSICVNEDINKVLINLLKY